MASDVTIKRVTTYEGFCECEDLQRAAWALDEDVEVVPGHMLHALGHNGGLVLGAYTSDGQIVGFVLGFIGKANERRTALAGRPYLHYSHMMGIHPAYQSRSVGFRLKLAQREHAIAQGDKLAIWTYDPLLGPNARLNIEKLGVICCRYVRNVYGHLEGIYAGLPTDRFEVEWWLNSNRVKNHLAGKVGMTSVKEWLDAGAQLLSPTSLSGGVRSPGEWENIPDTDMILVEVPGDFQAIRKVDIDLAMEWRTHFREISEAAFDAGYAATCYLSERAGEDRRNYYVLQRDLDLRAMAGGYDED